MMLWMTTHLLLCISKASESSDHEIYEFSIMDMPAFAISNSTNANVNGLYLPHGECTNTSRELKHTHHSIYLTITEKGNLTDDVIWMVTAPSYRANTVNPRKYSKLSGLLYYAQTNGLFELPHQWQFSLFKDQPMIYTCMDASRIYSLKHSIVSQLQSSLLSLECQLRQIRTQNIHPRIMQREIATQTNNSDSTKIVFDISSSWRNNFWALVSLLRVVRNRLLSVFW